MNSYRLSPDDGTELDDFAYEEEHIELESEISEYDMDDDDALTFEPDTASVAAPKPEVVLEEPPPPVILPPDEPPPGESVAAAAAAVAAPAKKAAPKKPAKK